MLDRHGPDSPPAAAATHACPGSVPQGAGGSHAAAIAPPARLIPSHIMLPMNWLSLPLLSADECRRIVGALTEIGGADAPVYGSAASGGVVDHRVRRVRRVGAPAEVAQVLDRALEAVQPRLAEHFGVVLTRFEPPQFLRYQTGDFFVAHQDGNTPIIRDDTVHRRVSAIVFLSDAGDYDGGALRFQKGGDAPSVQGSLLAFRSELTHEVTPLERGERLTVVTWYR
jgi:SM-20-related protein